MYKLCVCGCLYLSSYQQAQSGVKIGLRKLEELGIATTRPDDYFAEMVKTDDHMRKVQCKVTIIFSCSNLRNVCKR